MPVHARDGDVVGVIYFCMRSSPHHEEQRWQLAFSLIAAMIVASAAAGLAGMWGSRAIARPIQRLVKATEALARSDFHHRITTDGPGELHDLAKSFNLMADNLESTIASLTEAKEKAERSEASRRQFLADVSHNLRTPLAAVLGWTEALIDGLTSPDEQPLQLANIRQQTLYVSQNVQRLLDWSRWEDRPPQLVYEEFPISEPLMDVVQTLEEAAQSRDIELDLMGLQDSMGVRGDRTRVRELFQLLLENAVHHNPPGIRIVVTFKRVASRLSISVCDNGSGLPDELKRDLQSRVGGGLGLAIAARLAAAHGDSLRLEPVVGSGTCLTFTLETCENCPTAVPEYVSDEDSEPGSAPT